MNGKLVLLLIVALFFLGCSVSSNNLTSADYHSQLPEPREQLNSGRQMLGAWDISVDFTDLTASAVPIRSSQVHYQIVNMLIPPACDNCLVVDVYGFNPETHILSVYLTLRNPSSLDAYDARCIVHTNSLGHTLLNPDGYTSLWDHPGGGVLNPFIAYAKEAPYREFSSHGVYVELMQITVPDPPEYSLITYTIDASWPDNCTEPYMIDNFQQDPIFDSAGSDGSVQIDVYDWQNDVSQVRLYVPEVAGPNSIYLVHQEGNTWAGTVENVTGIGVGKYAAKVTASSPGSSTTELVDYTAVTITEGTISLVDELFAPPTAMELQYVLLDWASRDLSVKDFIIHGLETKLDGSRMYLVSQSIHGELHYGLIKIPPGYHPPDSLPILLMTHGGTWGTSDTALHSSGYVSDNFIQVAPSFRGEPIVIYGGPLAGIYESEGTTDPYDGDADDTISMLNLVLETIPSADVSRIAVSGGSRGGGAALRTRIRDDRIKVAACFFGATDYFVPELKEAAIHHMLDESYLGDDALEQGVIGRVLIPLKLGYFTMAEARNRMIKGSPVLFAEKLPRVQVHHGALDPVVPVHQSDSLDAKMQLLGITSPDYEYYRYPLGEHTKESLPGASDRVLEMLIWLVNET